ncbi:hypothetical protein [Streptomyces wuyuanensis]|uniref:Uncharacterized protein n=1 Tax=Streptomyces wuyuanensis TaxID=1196353 RepID=A0A1H0B5V1_9ACTN|nr:hypothetical protein [Streptomyces wuyuanensis]SDN40942.1 hypothetical protein SAMN05444921_12667 [Streptomyces wuyuanensis]
MNERGAGYGPVAMRGKEAPAGGAVVDETGANAWSSEIHIEESEILTARGEILNLADAVRWAVDIFTTASAVLLALLAARGHKPV